MALSYSTLAAGLGISKQMVGKLAHRGMPLDSVAAAMEWRGRNLNPAQRKPSPQPSTGVDAPPARVAADESFDQARTREKIAEADKAEMEAEKMRGILIDKALVRRARESEAGRVREAIMQLADRLAPVLEMRPVGFIRLTLDTELRAALHALSSEDGG